MHFAYYYLEKYKVVYSIYNYITWLEILQGKLFTKLCKILMYFLDNLFPFGKKKENSGNTAFKKLFLWYLNIRIYPFFNSQIKLVRISWLTYVSLTYLLTKDNILYQ